ncbi:MULTISPECIES: adenylate/guanylate cyclase domain-containing protein [unclassified Oceanispirochaeta]|uniref:adenylate/guanylate cyclase domain-containing protein n=1 Tax=unclassified Oceanispirochaeta TaxID=2635722 RepID=UPI00131466FF|nr:MULTISPECIES: adenylate/guanylate cyclase domain-containing protein [unclassified Oceanispirochaeta]MBF9017102.1 HAMP domain-containing protein [Oceanispirochaeta sp. M2]NPD73551.1 HAMP domain-containing protein [Oceanispirochaeta sp. M1]
MPQNLLPYFKKNLKNLETLISQTESMIRQSATQRGRTGSGLIHAFSELHYLAGFLNLISLSRLSFLGGLYLTSKASGSRRLSGREKSLLLTLMKQIRQIYDSITMAEDYGSFITPSQVMIYPSVERINEESLKWIIKRFAREGVSLPARFPLRAVSMERTRTGDWDLKVPDPVFHQAGRGEYLSIAYIDLAKWENPLSLVDSLRTWKQEGSLQFHGPLELPLEEEADAPTLPYYFIIKSRVEPERFWEKNRIPVRLLSTLSGPDQKIKLVRNAEPDDKKLDFDPEETKNLEDQTLFFDPESVAESEFPVAEKKITHPEEEDLDQLDEENSEFNRRGKAEPGTTIKYPIGIKMSIITSLIIIIALTGMIMLATYFFLQDSQVRVEESNLKISETIAAQVEESLLAIGNSASLLLLGVGDEDSVSQRNFKSYYFRSERNILFAGITEEGRLFYNESLLAELDVSESFIQGVIDDHSEQIRLAKGGTASVFNVSTYFGIPVLGITIPYKQEQGIKTLFILTDIRDNLQKAVQSRGITSTFIVDSTGNLIAHPDKTIVTSGVNLGDLTIVKELFSSAVNTGQIRYEQEDKEVFFGSYKKISFGRLGVITTVPEELAFEAIYRIQRRNILLMIMFVALAILIIYYYSKSLSGPIRKLVGATQAIEAGNYTLDLKPKSQDEVGVLTRAFLNMGMGLEEKERIKDAFGRFVNKEVAELAEKGEIQLGGEIKNATIFFSDIRSFTAISEQLTPEEVVIFLNEYMTLMVDCVNQTKGAVDKYIGDAIMAIWGAPISHGNDAENAVNGALLMRTALRKFNQDRGGDRKPIIKIGCGLNSGEVLAGQIGSNYRMEYTVIGDAVNLASRIEALNKPMGSDVLISQGTADIVEGIFDLVPMNKIMVKGKSEPQQIYAVLGRMDNPDRPRSMKELREKVGITGDFDNIADVNMEKEEVKYEIID